MKKNRLLSLLLSLALVFGVLPIVELRANAAVVLGLDDSYNIKAKTPSQSLAFNTGYVRNKDAGTSGNGTKKQLEVMVQLKELTSPSAVGAVVMRAADYTSSDLYKGSPTDINDTSIFAPNAAVQKAYYGIGLRTAQAGETELKLEIVDYATADKNNMLSGGPVTYKDMKESAVKATAPYYYEEYVLVVFAQDTSGAVEKYYVDRFYMDSDGYVSTPSYAVRYNGNNPPHTSGYTNNVTDVPGFQIQRAAWTDTRADAAAQDPGNMTLSERLPKRTGYEFVGWTTAALDPLAEGTETPTNGSNVTSGTKSATFYTVSGEFPKQTLYSVTDLYALWRVIPVKFSHTSQADKYTIAEEGGKWVMTWSNPIPQVGVGFNAGNIAFAQGPGGKIYKVVTSEDGKQIHDSGTPTVNPPVSKYTLAVKKGSADANWTITGTPQNDSNGKKAELEITVTDVSNDTSDTITVRFPQVKKRAQNAPDVDVNTGLEGDVDTLDGTDKKLPQAVEDAKLAELNAEGGTHIAADLYEFKDGRLIGFYSTGQKTYTDVGGNKMNDGTGSLRDYYLKNGMVYEYRPYKTDAEPDEGWREVPYPENYYSGANKTAVTNAMGYRATATAYTEGKIVTNVSQAGVSKVTAGTRTDPWPADYGWIVWENNLPAIHGLTEGGIYEVRFRSNSTSSASPPVQVAVVAGGAATVPTPGGSGGLAINLSGGDEPTGAAKDVYDKFVSDAAALKPNDTLKIPEFIPARENYTFAGWTLGERDENGQLILYRSGEVTPPEPEPETVAVKWIDGSDSSEIPHTLTSVPKGSTIPTDQYPTPPDHTAAGLTFVDWTVAVDETSGEITITANYTAAAASQDESEPPAAGSATVTWVDSQLEAGQEGYQIKQDQVTLTEGGELPDTLEHPTAPEHEGYTFDRWDVTKNEDGSYTVTALYKQNEPPEPPAQTILDTVTMPETSPASLAAVWEGGGSSDPDMSLVRTITFLDWDGSTKLGVVAVQKGYGMAASDYANMLNGRYDASVMSLSDFTLMPTASEGYIYNPGRANAETAMLTDKGGYTFVGWVPGDAEFTHYPMGTDLSTIGLIDWSTYKVEDHMDVKACYVGNSKCGTANNVYYTLEYADIERSGANYTVRVNVSRYYSAERDAFPMRMQDPILRVQLNLNGSSTAVSLTIPLDNKDYTSASFTFPAVMDRVQIAAADVYGQNGVAANAAARSRAIDLSNNDNASRQNYLKYGATYLVNDNARTATGLTASTRLTNFANAAAFTPLGITVTGGNSVAQALSTKLLSTWRYLNGWTKPGSTWVKPEGEVKPEDEVTLTQPQIVAIHEDNANVYLRHVTFVDTDNRAEYIAGKFTWEVAQPVDASVKTAVPAGFKIYWSRDGMTKSSKDPIAVTVTDGVYSISEGIRKQYYDRYLLVCAVDGSGTELPVSAVIPIIDFACD